MARNDYRKGIFTVFDRQNTNRGWIGVNMGATAVSFSMAGEVLYATPDARAELRYLVERDDGTTLITSYNEFTKLIGQQ